MADTATYLLQNNGSEVRLRVCMCVKIFYFHVLICVFSFSFTEDSIRNLEFQLSFYRKQYLELFAGKYITEVWIVPDETYNIFFLLAITFVCLIVSFQISALASHSDYDPLPWSAIALRHARFRAWCVFLSSINFTFTRRFRIVMPIEILEHLHVKTAIQHAKRLRVEYNAIRLLVKLFFFI